MTIACGQCWGCKLEKARQWAIRATHEAQLHEITSFITLSYDEEHLPPDKSIDVGHWQNFAKRLRHRIGPFRFLHCGEYGRADPKLIHGGKRPHYHALIYGYDWSKDRYFWKMSNGFRIFRSPSLEKIWTYGHCYIGSLTTESAGYVARYTLKKQSGPDAKTEYGWEEKSVDRDTGEIKFGHIRRPPYITMSRNPGLGANWLKKYKADVYPCDEVLLNGVRSRPPTYYDKLLERDDPKLMQTLKSKRKYQASLQASEQTYDRLEVRERVNKARTERLHRPL